MRIDKRKHRTKGIISEIKTQLQGRNTILQGRLL